MDVLTVARTSAVRFGAALACLALACGGDAAGPETGGDARITATIDGRAWSSNALGGADVAVHSAPGSYSFQGTETSGSTATTITVTLYNIRRTGTYPLGMNASTVGGTALLVDGARGWSTPLSGNAGEITLTEVSSTRLAGTFSFNADGLSGGATGTRAVTAGRFDLPVRVIGTPGPLPESAGSRVSASLGGTPWNAATVAGAVTPAGALVFTASNTSRTLSVSLAGVAGPGTYALASNRVIVVTNPAQPTQGWGTGAGTTGSVTVEAVTASRITGSFSASLAPSGGATGTLAVTNGVFDLGRP